MSGSMTGSELRPPDLDNLVDETGEHLSDERAGRAHLSHSQIGVMLSCNRKWHYEYDLGLELIERPNYFDMGSALHLAVEHGDPEVAFTAMYDAREERVHTAEGAQALRIDAAVCRAAARGYLKMYGKPAQTRELKYRIKLRSPYTGAYSRTFDLMGAADGVTDHGAYLELDEDKFVGQIDKAAIQKVALDRQISLEAYALWRVTGKEVRVVNYRHTRKPSIKLKKDESVEDYIARVDADYLERPEFYFHQEATFRSAGDLLEMEEELWEWAEQLRGEKSRGVFPKNTGSCKGNRGNCLFLPLCSGDPDAEHLYQVKAPR